VEGDPLDLDLLAEDGQHVAGLRPCAPFDRLGTVSADTHWQNPTEAA